ncbi:MAG: TerB family tellurite resistance protein [Rhodospirillaceae bacterium]|nr:TerB family tellurite resistance protein [Rhodospirillaceae bacterium]MBL6931368.1 TerB family tellurite resistance protein [Rhodospirillales bacterium]
MIEKLKNLLAGRKGKDANAAADAQTLKLASSALLMEAACMDGHADANEIATVTALLGAHFDLQPDEAHELAEAGREAVANSVELYGFTRTIKDSFNHEDRVRMIEMLWEVAYADGILHDFEANLVRRVSGLIYVADRESGDARKRVLERLDLDGPDVS